MATNINEFSASHSILVRTGQLHPVQRHGYGLFSIQQDPAMISEHAFRIVEGAIADANNIAELSRQEIETGLGWRWNAARVTRAIRHPRTVVLVAKAQLRFAGFGIMRYDKYKANLNLLAVKTECRNTGIGTALVSTLQNTATSNDIENIYVQVREKNLRAIRFYEGLGYAMIDLTKKYYSGRENAVILYRYSPVAHRNVARQS